MGEIAVPTDRYWGAQTQRSLHHFNIGVERFPRQMIRALGDPQEGRRAGNGELGRCRRDQADLIVRAADEVIDGQARRRTSRWSSGRPAAARRRT